MIYLYLSIAIALIDWLVVAVERRNIEYLAKPGVMIFLIIWFITQMPTDRGWLSLFILVGLIFSLAGDVFLMLPGNWFLAGLVAFLVAHLAYIGGFNANGFTFHWRSLLFALIIILCAIPIYLRIRSGLIAGGNKSLVFPVTAYVIVISFMVFSATTTFFNENWSFQAGLFVTIGAALFFASDAVLAWNRFVRPITQGGLITIIPYHLAQYFIAAGTLINLGVFRGG
jgi:uncharacterized membrane protein YhhN